MTSYARLALALPVASMLVLACGPASVSGTIDNRPIPSPDAVGQRTSLFNARGVSVTIGGGSGQLCVDLDKGNGYKNAAYLELSAGMNGEFQPGEYMIGGVPVLNDRFASASVRLLDAACGVAITKSAGEGSITITQVDGNGVSGEFNLLFGSERLTGAFNAALCGTTGLPSLDVCL